VTTVIVFYNFVSPESITTTSLGFGCFCSAALAAFLPSSKPFLYSYTILSTLYQFPHLFQSIAHFQPF
jgi:hypothetical protein